MPKFKVKIWEKPFSYRIDAKSKEEAKRKVMRIHAPDEYYSEVWKMEAKKCKE